MSLRTRIWRWWLEPAGRRIHVIPAYIILAVALFVGVGAVRHLDAHNRAQACEIGRSNDVAVQGSLILMSSTINGIILAAVGNPRDQANPRAQAIADQLDAMNLKIAQVTVRTCGSTGVVPPTTTTP
jgi:hypothetical protein